MILTSYSSFQRPCTRNIFVRIFFAALLFSSVVVSGQNGWGDLTYGTYKVGFNVTHTYDYSRSFKLLKDSLGNPVKGERARPMQVCVWYPADAVPSNHATEMTYDNYVWLMATQFTEGKLNDSLKKNCLDEMVKAGFRKEKVEMELKSKTRAFKYAVPAKSKFPVILYACSWSAPAYENYVLCELLASNGYVVVACPSMGAYTADMTGDMLGVETQVEDLRFILNYACNLPYVDKNKIGVAGFSWGGLANVLLQQKNNKIGAVVSYDGSIANANGMEHFKNFPGSSYSKMNVPFMYMSQRDRKENPFYEKLNYSDAYYMIFPKNGHRDFASMFIKTVNKYKNDTIEKFKMKNYEWICKYTLNFFNAYIMQDKESLKFMDADPKEHGIADTVMTMVYKKAKPMPPSENDFLRTYRKEGFQKAKEMYLQVHSADPDYILFSEATLNDLGYGLYKKDKLDEATQLLQLNAEAFPGSDNVYDSLADVYLKKGDKDKAIENYRKALEINPKSPSKAKLDKLTNEAVK